LPIEFRQERIGRVQHVAFKKNGGVCGRLRIGFEVCDAGLNVAGQ
jgi:hypothetical protein